MLGGCNGNARERVRGGVGGEVCCGSVGLAGMGSGGRGSGKGGVTRDASEGDWRRHGKLVGVVSGGRGGGEGETVRGERG